MLTNKVYVWGQQDEQTFRVRLRWFGLHARKGISATTKKRRVEDEVKCILKSREPIIMERHAGISFHLLLLLHAETPPGAEGILQIELIMPT